MKVSLYSEALNLIKKSGLGKAIEHQKKALKITGVNFTCQYLFFKKLFVRKRS